MSSVTYVDIEKAIATLLSQKQSITLANIRKALGDRGSMSTLSKYLQQWKSQRYIDPENKTTPIVDPAPDTIFSAVQTVWQQMQGHGEQQLAEQEQRFQEQKDIWDREKQALIAQVSYKDSVIETLSQDYTSVRDQYNDLSLQHSSLIAEHKILSIRFNDLENALATRAQGYENTISDLLSKITENTHSFITAQKEHVQALSDQRTALETTLSHAEAHHQKQYQELLASAQKDQERIAVLSVQLQNAANFQVLSTQLIAQNTALEQTLASVSKQCSQGFLTVRENIKQLSYAQGYGNSLNHALPLKTKGVI